MSGIDLLGYAAMITVAVSFLLKDVLKLRLVNAMGAVLFVIYGMLMKAYPVAGLNIFVVIVNGYYIWKGLKNRA